ncbi:ABC transporter substrate-binding protein [Tatumella sp. UBA2305]|uniref:ABC transporter substrate-binding protein n=1 Tax=Tatumella sp. UBA2305 TaxID=1947647 RepID=UPI0025EC0E79|nr:ABC transporter substrate-binding protein [Tatumella sp. UBA2305]
MLSRRNFVISGSAAFMIMIGGNAFAQRKILRIGFQKFSTINILKGTGRLEQALLNLGVTVKWVEFTSAPATFEALNSGNIDIAHAGDTNTVFAQASGINYTYLAAEVPNPEGLALVVPVDSDIRNIHDLHGRKFVTGKGWTPQYLMFRALQAADMSYAEINSLYVTMVADAQLAFEAHQADVTGLWEPYLSVAEAGGTTRILRNAEGLADNRTIYVGNPDYVSGNPDVLSVFFRELSATNKWAKANPDKVASLFSPILRIPEKTLQLASGRRNYGIEIINPQIISAQQKIADAFFTLKLIPNAIRVQQARFADSQRFI